MVVVEKQMLHKMYFCEMYLQTENANVYLRAVSNLLTIHINYITNIICMFSYEMRLC